MSKSDQPATTIAQAFEEFLVDQKDRISPKTFSKYETIIGLYKSYLENYWPGHDADYGNITKKGGTIAARLRQRTPSRDTANSSAISCLAKSCAAKKQCKPPARSRRSWRSGCLKKVTPKATNLPRNHQPRPPLGKTLTCLMAISSKIRPPVALPDSVPPRSKILRHLLFGFTPLLRNEGNKKTPFSC